MMRYLLISVLLPVLLAGCATNEMQMQVNHNSRTVENLARRVSALEAAQQQLNKKVADSAVRTPSGVVAIPTERGGATGAMSGADHGLALGIEQFRAGNIDGAITTLSQVVSTDAGQAQEDALYWLGNAFYTQRDFANANRFLGQYLGASPTGEYAGRALPMLIQSLRASGRDQDADILQSNGVDAINR